MPKKSKDAAAAKSKDPNDRITGSVWKLIKYTQGENKDGISIKFHMPVFVHIYDEYGNDSTAESVPNAEVEVKIMACLPVQFQFDAVDEDKVPQEPPCPNDEEIKFEIFDEFKCYVR